MWMRAIEPEAVNALRPPGVAITPTVTIAAIATSAATTRQKVSLRRILRRSTITSESSDIENSPKGRSLGDCTVFVTQGPGRNWGPVLIEARKREAYLSLRCLSAVPRMSPSVAPESEEPY